MIKTLEGYRWALDALASARGDHGYVLEAHDKAGIPVHLRSDLRLKTDAIGYIEKQDGAKAAMVRLYNQNGLVFAEIVESLSGRPVEPFDRVIILQ